MFILACGAVETARLMLMSTLRDGSPHGLANANDLVGRNVTFHEYSASVGTFEDPIYAWAGGGYVSPSSFEFYENDASRGFVSGGHIAAAGVGIPLPINWGLPGTDLGRRGQADRPRLLQPLDGRGHGARTTCPSTTTASTWTTGHGRLGAPRRPDHPDAARERPGPGPVPDRPMRGHPRGGWRPRRDRVYADRVTGNCSHQHGTARMGDDPETSVPDRNCRAHEVDNLYVVDGSPFPTATGANPTLTIMANAWRVAEHIATGAGNRG